MPVFVRFFFFLENAFVQFSQVFNEKEVLLCIRESAAFNERSNWSLSAFRIVSTRMSHGGICPFSKPSILSPAKLIQLSIQCFWSINEDSLCSALYYCTLVTHMQFFCSWKRDCRSSQLYPVAFGNQRWLCSSGSHCSSCSCLDFSCFAFSFLLGRFIFFPHIFS